MQQECDLLCSERWEAPLLGHRRRLQMRLKFKLTVWVRAVGPVWTLPELAQVALEALANSRCEGSAFRAERANQRACG